MNALNYLSQTVLKEQINDAKERNKEVLLTWIPAFAISLYTSFLYVFIKKGSFIDLDPRFRGERIGGFLCEKHKKQVNLKSTFRINSTLF